MKRGNKTDKEIIKIVVEKIANARPDTDKTVHRAKANRKKYVKRLPDGTFNVGTKPGAGWYGSIVPLLTTTKYQFGKPDCKYCSRPNCRQPAVSGNDECRMHGGRMDIVRRKALDHCYKPKAKTVRRQQLYNLINMGMIPDDLKRIPAFAEALETALEKWRPDKDDLDTKRNYHKGEFKHACQKLALQMIVGWYALQNDNDHGPWQEAVRAANFMGFRM